ncbi:MAG: tryptophan--tRNA ligase [Patescibacteria group bacterium]
MAKPVVFSGVQPSGNLHLGNYLGAIAQWVLMQEKNQCIFCVVDYHAITVKQEPEVLKEKIIEVAKIYLASGIDPKKSIIFQQSDISAHTELTWILNCVARMSDLFRMTQFKDKTKVDLEKIIEEVEKRIIAQSETLIVSSEINKLIKELCISLGNIRKSGLGLFDYPVLMASDILLYNTDAVPVGEDQAQHVELCRTLGRRFNSQFGETFKIPEVVIRKEGARIMGLDDPSKKMSKSAESEYNYIGLTDKPEVAAKKIMKAVTDSGHEIKYDEKAKPAISNLLTIYSLLTDEPMKKLEAKYKGKGYGDFKKDLAEVVKKFLTDFQERYKKISDKEVEKILEDGAKKAELIANETLKRVKEKIGII